jgi:cytohesin
VEILLTARANPNLKDKQGRLAVELAAQEDYAEIVRLLVAKKSEVPNVFVAASAGVTDGLKAMLKDNPALVKLRNGQGFQPLHVAAREGHADTVQALIAAGADVKAVDDHPADERRNQYTNGWTPLHLAVMAGKSATAVALLDHGADVNAADKDGGLTPLHFAAWEGNADLVNLLLARKADRTITDDGNRSPLDLAKERGHTKVVKLLAK